LFSKGIIKKNRVAVGTKSNRAVARFPLPPPTPRETGSGLDAGASRFSFMLRETTLEASLCR
jgi:hypothetical protein